MVEHTPLVARMLIAVDALGKSDKRAAKEAGLGYYFFRDLRSGKSKSPRIDNYLKAAAYLKISPDDAFGIDEQRVGNRIKLWRQFKKLTLSGVARNLDIDRSIWHDYEESLRDIPDIALVHFGAITLASLDYLFRGDLRGVEDDFRLWLAAPTMQSPGSPATADGMGTSQSPATRRRPTPNKVRSG